VPAIVSVAIVAGLIAAAMLRDRVKPITPEEP